MRAASAAVFGLVWLVLGCGSHLLSEPDPALPPAEQPDECDLPEPCPGSVDNLDCYGSDLPGAPRVPLRSAGR